MSLTAVPVKSSVALSTMPLDVLTNFKQFLNSNFSDIGMISVIVALSLIVMSFATREILSWLTKTDRLRKEIRDLKKMLGRLESEIEKLNQKAAPAFPTDSVASESKEGPRWTTDQKEKPSSFPLNH